MVYRTKKHTRTTFRKLPFGSKFWLTSAGTATAPLIKGGRTGYLNVYTQGGTIPTIATVDTSSEVIVAPRQWAGRNMSA